VRKYIVVIPEALLTARARPRLTVALGAGSINIDKSLDLYLLSQTLHLQTNVCCSGEGGVLDFMPHFSPSFQKFDETLNRIRTALAEWKL